MMALSRSTVAIVALLLVLTSSASGAKLAEEPMAEEAMGESPMGEEAMGEEAMGEEPMAEEAMGEEAMGEEPMAEEAMGEEAMGEAPVEDAMEDAPASAEEAPADEAAIEPSPPPAEESCESLCEHAEGEAAESCRTRCATSTDVMTHHNEEGLDDFVEDEVTNEHGGTAMEDHAEEEYGMQIADCEPTVDITEPPAFSDIDTQPEGGLFDFITGDGDGYITMEEAQAWAARACIPDEDMHQLFSQTDANQDGMVDPEEFAAAGEDTHLEEEIDEEFDKVLPEGDDEPKTANMPDFDTFDENGDGLLEEDEVEATFELEGHRRGVSADDMDLIKEEVHDALKKMDEDGDGALNKEEFERIANNDLGDEMKEQAMADEDEEDPDDLHREGSKAAKKAAEREEREAAKAAEKEDREAAKAARKEEKEAAKAARKEEKEAAKAAKKEEKEAAKAAKKASKFLAVRRPAPVVAHAALHMGARHRRTSTSQSSTAAARRMRIMARIQAPGSASARWQAAAVAIALRKAEHHHHHAH